MDLDSLHPPQCRQEKKILTYTLSCLPCWSYLAVGLKPWGRAPASVPPVYSLLLEESGWVIAHLTLRPKQEVSPYNTWYSSGVYPSLSTLALGAACVCVCIGTGRVITDCKLLTKQNTFIWSVEPEWKWPVGCIIEQGRD